MLSRLIKVEEQKHFAEYIKQIENKRSLEYQHKQRRDQIIPDPPLLQIDIMMTRDKKNVIVKKHLKSRNSQDSFKDKKT